MLNLLCFREVPLSFLQGTPSLRRPLFCTHFGRDSNVLRTSKLADASLRLFVTARDLDRLRTDLTARGLQR